jgi:hypothetical protein
MGTSKVDFRGQSFWTRDSVVRVVLALLVAELDPVTTSEPELDALLNRWALNAALGVTGAVDAVMDDYVTNDHIVELIHTAIPPIQGRLPNDAVVEVADPAFLRRTAVGMAPPTDALARVLPGFARFWLRWTDCSLASCLMCEEAIGGLTTVVSARFASATHEYVTERLSAVTPPMSYTSSRHERNAACPDVASSLQQHGRSRCVNRCDKALAVEVNGTRLAEAVGSSKPAASGSLGA